MWVAALAVIGRRTIYLQPLGEFSPIQLRVLERTADYIASVDA